MNTHIIALLLIVILVIMICTRTKDTFIDEKDIQYHVISLKHRTDRRNRIIEQFKKHNIQNYIIHDAVDGRTLDKNEMLNHGGLTNNKLTLGEIGCYLSHIHIWEQIKKSNYPLHIVMEDDAIFMDNYNKKLGIICKKLDTFKWDILYFGLRNVDYGEPLMDTETTLYKPTTLRYGLHGYLINKSFIDKVSNIHPIQWQIDHLLMLKCMNNEITCLALKNALIDAFDLTDSETQKIR